MPKIVILQEYIPSYRTPFFAALASRAQEYGIDLVVAAGAPGRTQASRRDESDAFASVRLHQREYQFAGRRIVIRNASKVIRGADLVVVEQARRNLDVYSMLLRRRRGRLVALWGHGKDYTKRSPLLDRWLHGFITSRSDWFFAYTPGGARAVEERGFPRKRTTVVQNSTDSLRLASDVDAVSSAELGSFRREYDLRDATALFIGGLDASKRLPFLFESADMMHARNNDFRLLIAGSGAEERLVVEAAAKRDWIRYLGPTGGRAKAVALRASDVLAMPGRVGLVAVDSFAAATPIVTTDWEYHAPEFEYLRNGSNALITQNDTSAYAFGMLQLLENRAELMSMEHSCRASRSTYSVESMADNFLEGVLRCLSIQS